MEGERSLRKEVPAFDVSSEYKGVPYRIEGDDAVVVRAKSGAELSIRPQVSMTPEMFAEMKSSIRESRRYASLSPDLPLSLLLKYQDGKKEYSAQQQERKQQVELLENMDEEIAEALGISVEEYRQLYDTGCEILEAYWKSQK